MHQDLKQSLRFIRNLQVVEYDKIDDEHSGFAAAINKLLELVEAERAKLVGTLEW